MGAVVVNIVGMAEVYMSQDDIARLLGTGRTQVNVWRARFPDFPAPDIQLGMGDRSVPGWKPERIEDVKAWRSAHPGLMRPAAAKPTGQSGHSAM